MNFLFKIIMLFSFSVFTFATCTTPDTNTTGLLRLSHNVCPELFIPHPDKEKATITYYDNNYTSPSAGSVISIIIDKKIFKQDWITNLPITLTHLRTRINNDGEFTATASGPKIIITAKEPGYKVDTLAIGGTPTNSLGQFSAQEVNNTSAASIGNGINLREGSKAIAEVVTFDFNGTSVPEDINFSRSIRKITFTINGSANSTDTVSDTAANFATRLVALGAGATVTTAFNTADGTITFTNKTPGATSMSIVVEHNTSGSYVSSTIGSGGVGTREANTSGRNAITSIKRLYYYGNEGNYSIRFWPFGTASNRDVYSNDGNYTIETPYLGTLRKTLDYLKILIDINGTYSSTVGILSNDHGYLQLTDRTPRDTNYTLGGKSGNGNAKVVTNTQGKATPEDINMTSISYNDNFLYTTYDIDYDVDESDANYSSAKQDILEIFKVDHINNPDNAAINTLNLTSATVLRHDENVTSIVSANDIVFLGDENTTYYRFSRSSSVKKLTDMKKLEEPNMIETVQASTTAHFQDGRDGYVFLADDTRMRIYKVDQVNKVTHYMTHHNFGGKISDINRDGQYLYVQSNSGDMLTKFIIVNENTRFSVERVKTFTLDAEKVYVRGDYIYYTMGSGVDIDKGYAAKIGDTSIESVKKVEDNKVSFMVGDEFYSASIGLDGLKIYNYMNELNASDNSYAGSRILILGEYIITDDYNSSQIRIYKFGDVSVSSREGEGSLAKPFNVKMLANKVNIDDVNWTIRKNGELAVANLRQKSPVFPFTETGLWFVKATVSYKDYPYASEYLYRINVVEDNVPGVEINASSMGGLKGLKVDFTSIITKNSYVDSTMWDFNDTNKSESMPATSVLRNPSWVFNDAGDYNVTFMVFYDRDKNITKNIIIHISDPLEINTTNPDGNNTTTHIKGEDVNLSVGLAGNADFTTITGTVDAGTLATVAATIKSYTWRSVGAKNPMSHLESPIFVYNRTGTYTVNLEIIRGDGVKFTAKKTISVVNFQEPAITADKLSGETPLTVNFGVSLEGYLVKDVRPKSVSWTFTNGGTSQKQNPTFTFVDEAVITVKADVELSDGSTLNLEKVITISNKVDLEIEANALEGYTPLTVNLIATGSSFEGINRYEWEIGLRGKEKVKKTGTSLEHTFDANGTYEINATAFSNKDHNGTASLVLRVEKGPDVTIKGELVSPTDQTNYKFTAMRQTGDTNFDDANTSWFVNNVEVASKTLVMTYKFLESKGYKVEFRVALTGGVIVNYVYDRNPSFNPYIQKVQVYTGWNLLSSPLDEKFAILSTGGDPVPQQATDSLQRLRDISSVIWKFTNNTWSKDPVMIEKRIGFWMKATTNKELVFDGNTIYEPDLTNLTSGNWYLVGTGKELKNYKANNGSINVVWVYRKGKWYKNPSVISAGDGLWIKAN